MQSRMKFTSLNLLKVLSLPENASVLKIFNERKFRKKQVLYYPGCEENAVFIVKKGRLRISMASEDKELSLAILAPGDIYSSHTRAVVDALEGGSILCCSVDDFRKAALEHPEFLLMMITVLGDLLSNSMTIIEDLYLHDVDLRAAVFFYEEGLHRGIPHQDGVILRLGLTVDHIAKMLGACRQTISSLLSMLEKEGIIEKLSRGEYLIRDMQRLKMLAYPKS